MSFLPHQSDNGLQPWEYYPAAGGSYTVGQMLTMNGGQLAPQTTASTVTPPYLCMASVTVTDGQLVPVIRVTRDVIFETQLSAAAEEAAIGTKLQVSAGGLQADAAAAGTFEVVFIDGTAAGNTVRGRFH